MAAGIKLLNLGNRVRFDETQIKRGRMTHEGMASYYEMLESDGRVAVLLGRAAARETTQAQLVAHPTQMFDLRAAHLIFNVASGRLVTADPNEVVLGIVQLGHASDSVEMASARYAALSRQLLQEMQASPANGHELGVYFQELAERREYLTAGLATLVLPSEAEPTTFDVLYALQATEPQRQDAFLIAAATIASEALSGPMLPRTN